MTSFLGWSPPRPYLSYSPELITILIFSIIYSSRKSLHKHELHHASFQFTVRRSPMLARTLPLLSVCVSCSLVFSSLSLLDSSPSTPTWIHIFPDLRKQKQTQNGPSGCIVMASKDSLPPSLHRSLSCKNTSHFCLHISMTHCLVFYTLFATNQQAGRPSCQPPSQDGSVSSWMLPPLKPGTEKSPLALGWGGPSCPHSRNHLNLGVFN